MNRKRVEIRFEYENIFITQLITIQPCISPYYASSEMKQRFVLYLHIATHYLVGIPMLLCD